jgi:NADH:ubiquinone oxidoreductase subunit 5 (subunit L)/multisubunit Na+/H+ antiporter MnhA subunit
LARLALGFDRSLIDGALHALAGLCRQCGQGLRTLQNGQVQAYALVMLFGVAAGLLYFLVGMN